MNAGLFRYDAKEPIPGETNQEGFTPAEGWIVEVEKKREATKNRNAQSPIYRSSIAKNKLADPVFDGCRTLREIFERSASKFADQPCLGNRIIQSDGSASEYKWISYKEVAEKVSATASGLLTEGIKTKDAVGVFGPNSPEWFVAMQACNRMNAKCVPLYDSLGENAVEYIINHAQCTAVFVSNKNISALLKSKGKIASVKEVIYWGEPTPAELKAMAGLGVTTRSFAELVDIGERSPKDAVQATSDDIGTIMYTSGTTGNPKGVLLAQKNLVSEIAAIAENLEVAMGLKVGPGEVYCSYLPLAHIFDRVVEEVMIACGGCIGYWQGDVKKLVDDIGALKPTFFCGVPRIFDRIYAAVMAKLGASFVSSLLYKIALSRKYAKMKKGVSQKVAAPLWDKIIFSKIKDRLGGRVKMIMSGGAPLSAHVEKFLRVAMCCPVVQGYGLTETCAASFSAIPDTIEHAATVGIPFPSVEYRLEAVPEMNYDPLENPPRGEVIIRGTPVFAGYYKDDKQTSECMDKDGFFHTGDVGELTPDGGLKIIDRKKNIFKLSQGEYVAVEVVESVYKKNLAIEQLWVYGNSFESALVAVVVPNEAKLTAWAKEKGIAGDFAALCASPECNAYILSELQSTGRAAKLKGFEIVKAVHVDSTEFSVEESLLTPTFKLKRPQLLKRYKKEVDALYAGLKK